jgi:hypothetical protein
MNLLFFFLFTKRNIRDIRFCSKLLALPEQALPIACAGWAHGLKIMRDSKLFKTAPVLVMELFELG